MFWLKKVHLEKIASTNTIIIIIKNNFFLSLLLLNRCIVSLSQTFLNNTELKIFGRHQESNTGPAERISALSLSYSNQLANKHSNSVFILLRDTAMLQFHSTDQRKLSFSKIIFIR